MISNRAVLNLFLKNFESGWRDYEARLNIINNDVTNFKLYLNIDDLPIWNGSNKCKHLLVISEQGLGDEIFHLSILKYILDKVEKITVCLDKRLITILSRSFPSVTFIEKNISVNKSDYDFQVPLGSLLGLLNIVPSKSPSERTPYLIDNLNITTIIKKSNLFKDKFTCGIAWKSSNPKLGGPKSINLKDFKNIIDVPNCEFINLQYGDVCQDIKNLEELTGVKINKLDSIDIFNDIDGLLSVIKSCDIVVTTSNVTAHLSGAIGKKTYLLLPYSKGRIWYWHDENVSSWYPTIKQFFQASDFTWDAAINKVALDLKKS
jgi:hypothetical protein